MHIPPGLSPGCCTRWDLSFHLTILRLTVPSSQIGLLGKDNIQQIPFAYKMFQTSNNHALAKGFKATFCREVPIEFIGVW